MRVHIKTPSREFDYEARDGASSFVVGNRKYDDICIEDDTGISGPHVRLEQFMGKWSFTDQFSTAGTIHNGAKKNSGDLAEGDKLLLGATLLTVTALQGGKPANDFAVPKAAEAPAADEFKVDPLAMQADFKAEWPEELADEVSDAESELHSEPAEEMRVVSRPEPARAQAPTHEVAARGPGSVFEQRIAALLVSQFMQDGGPDPRRDAAAMQRINEAARITVNTLEHSRSSWVNLPFLMADAAGPKHLKLEVHRRHLHERAEGEAVPHQQEKSPRNQPQPVVGPKPNKLVGALVASVIIVVAITGVVLPLVNEESQPDVPTPSDIVRQAAEQQAEAHRRVSEALKPLTAADSAIPPEVALEQLATIAAGVASDAGRVHAEINAAMRTLKNRVYSNMQKRYSAASLEVNSLESKGDLRGAAAVVADLKTHVNSNPNLVEAAGRLGMPAWFEDTTERIAESSDRLLGRQLPRVDAALAKQDFAAAHEALAAAEGALLSNNELAWLRAELTLLEAAAKRQADGLIDPPIKSPKRPPGLPVTLRNELLPGGSTQLARAASAMQGKVAEAFRGGTLTEVDATYFGHPAKVTGKARSSMLTARVTRRFGAEVRSSGGIEYTTDSTVYNLPADTQHALMLAVPAPSVENLLGIMQFCFQNGMPDKAGEAAFRIRQAAPEKKAALDEILGIKWEKAVPEGGFPERGGKVVPE